MKNFIKNEFYCSNIFLIALLFVLIFSLSCNDDTEYEIGFSPVTKVILQDTALINKNIEITVEHRGSNSCAEYSHYKLIDNILKYYYFEFYAKYPKDAVCMQEIIEINTTISLKFTQKGMNYLYFKKLEDKYLIDSVFVR